MYSPATSHDGMAADLSVIPMMVGGYRNPTAAVHPYKSLETCPLLSSIILNVWRGMPFSH